MLWSDSFTDYQRSTRCRSPLKTPPGKKNLSQAGLYKREGRHVEVRHPSLNSWGLVRHVDPSITRVSSSLSTVNSQARKQPCRGTRRNHKPGLRSTNEVDVPGMYLMSFPSLSFRRVLETLDQLNVRRTRFPTHSVFFS